MAASFSSGTWIKRRYEELRQRRRVLMVESSSLGAAAVVAAPMRKLCPENLEALMPDAVRATQIYFKIRSLERGLPFAILKKAPGSPWSNWFGGLVILPGRKKPKNHVVQAAHNLMWSGVCGWEFHNPRCWRRMLGVIGRCVRWGVLPCLACQKSLK